MNPITMNLVADDIIRFALREDMNAGDLSTESVCPERREAEVQLIAKAEGVIAGLDVFERAFTLLDPRTSFDARVADGDAVEPGQLLGIVRGDARVLLSGERVALNFLQRMSGIATYTRRMAAALEGTKTRLVDTRKTTPRCQSPLQPLPSGHAQGQSYRRCRRYRRCGGGRPRARAVRLHGRGRVRGPGHGARGARSRSRYHHA